LFPSYWDYYKSPAASFDSSFEISNAIIPRPRQRQAKCAFLWKDHLIFHTAELFRTGATKGLLWESLIPLHYFSIFFAFGQGNLVDGYVDAFVIA
jgi:hypothetical protein